MAIGTDSGIWFFGTQDEVSSLSPGPSSVANNAFSIPDDVENYTNDDDTPFGAAVLKCQFATMPTSGAIGLYARLLNIQGINDENIVDSNFSPHRIGKFNIDFGAGNGNDFFMGLKLFNMPQLGEGQDIEWYIKNEGTSQTISGEWQLWITPKSLGPHA